MGGVQRDNVAGLGVAFIVWFVAMMGKHYLYIISLMAYFTVARSNQSLYLLAF